jgi:hypothetical protein
METNIAPFAVNAMLGAVPNTDAGASHQRWGNWEHLEDLLLIQCKRLEHSFLFEILRIQRSLTWFVFLSSAFFSHFYFVILESLLQTWL